MAKNVHFLRLSDDWNAAEMESFFPLISPERRIRIQRLRVAADRKAALFTGLLSFRPSLGFSSMRCNSHGELMGSQRCRQHDL